MKSPAQAILDFWQPAEAEEPPRPASEPDREFGRRVLPLYVASLIATVAGIGSVAVTLTDQGPWTIRCVGLAVLGHVVSFYLRRRRVPAHVGYIPAVALLGVALVRASGSGDADLGVGADALTPDLALAVLISWLTAIRSFALVSNGALVFSSVPALATIGLSASVNPNSEVPVLFGVLLFATIFMAIYEQHAARISSQDSGSALAWHVATAGLVFATVLACGSVVGVVVGRVFSPLMPFAQPAISRMQAAAPNFVTAPQGQNSRVQIGGGPIRLLPIPVFDVFMPEPGLLRTGVLERYDGRSWSPMRQQSANRESHLAVAASPVPETNERIDLSQPLFRFQLEPPPDRHYPVPVREVRQTVVTRGMTPPRLPVLDCPVEVRLPTTHASYQAADGVVGAGAPDGVVGAGFFLEKGRLYEVVSNVPMIPPAGLRAARPCAEARGSVSDTCFAWPITAERIRGLAEQVTAGQTNDYDRVRAILAYIERTCTYSLMEEPTPEGEDAVEYYLFTTRVGACDLAASAAILLCRSINLPARAVTGYVADQPLPNGGYLVRQMDAHMWLEVFFPGYGWVPFNPSPPARDAAPSQTQWLMNQFRQIFTSLSRGGIDTYLILIVSLLALAAFGPAVYGAAARQWARWQTERALMRAGGPEALGIVYARMARRLARSGWNRDPAMTPAEYQRWLAQAWGSAEPATGCVARITEHLVRACYAEERDPAATSAAMRDLERLRRAVPRREGPRATGWATRWRARSATRPAG